MGFKPDNECKEHYFKNDFPNNQLREAAEKVVYEWHNSVGEECIETIMDEQLKKIHAALSYGNHMSSSIMTDERRRKWGEISVDAYKAFEELTKAIRDDYQKAYNEGYADGFQDTPK